MDNNSLAHTKWECKYHLVFAPKYRRQVIYKDIKADVGQILGMTRLCARNGLPHITVHGLRHMYATILIEMKGPLIKISALLGHASVNTTFEYYCEVMDENEQIITFMNNTFVPEGGVAIC